jgi:hypothetical protein
MPSQRLKGQEISLLIVRDGALEAELTDIQNFNAEFMLEQLAQGYLGEKTERHDEIYKGTKGDFEMHTHSQDWITFLAAIKDRAQRVTPDTVFNISAVLAYPNGQTPVVFFPDVKFGAMPLSVGSRDDYKKIKVDFVVDDFQITFS